MTKRAADDDDDSSFSCLPPATKSRRLQSGHSPPHNRLSLANCWDVAGEATHTLVADRFLAAVFTDWDASYNGSLSDQDLAKLLGMSPGTVNLHLRRLDLSYTLVSDAFIATLARWAPNLQALRLEFCPNVSDAALCALAQNCRALEELSVARCPNVTDWGVAAAAAQLPMLKALDLHGCTHITGAALKLLVARCPLVQHLRVGRTALDAACVAALVSHFLLVELDLSELPIEDMHLARLAAKQPLLQKLDVSHCGRLTRGGIEGLLATLPLTEIKAFGLFDVVQGVEDERLVF